jgi:hypothetical protein
MEFLFIYEENVTVTEAIYKATVIIMKIVVIIIGSFKC